MNELPFQYVAMTDMTHADAVVAMMNGLHSEDAAAHPPDRTRFPETVRFLLSHPAMGRILLLMAGSELAGYAILIPFWSNEFGGPVLFIDELFVHVAWRNRGIARGLFELLEGERPFGARALFLEVSPSNVRARTFYESLGFAQRANTTMARLL